MHRYIEIKIEQGIEQGEFRSDCDPDETATMIIISLEGAIIMTRVNSNPKYIQQTVKYLRQKVEALKN